MEYFVRMKNHFVLLTFIFLAISAVAHASTPLDYDLAKKAVGLAGQVDAYGVYCEKPTSFGDDFIKRFKDSKLEKARIQELSAIIGEAKKTTLTNLKSDKKSCKDLEFMMKQYDLMRSLKLSVYELNGVDPATVKDDIPALELLLPPKSGQSLTASDFPLEEDEAVSDIPMEAAPEAMPEKTTEKTQKEK